MRKVWILGLLGFLLIGCTSQDEVNQSAKNAFSEDMTAIENAVDDEWGKFRSMKESYESRELNEEEAYDTFDELRSELIHLSYEVEDVSINEGVSTEVKEKLKEIKLTYADAVYELAKVAGHYRNYLLSGDESYLDKVVERKVAYEEYMKEMNTMIERLS